MLRAYWREVRSLLAILPTIRSVNEQQLLLAGRAMADRQRRLIPPISFRDVEFKVFSQWGDDGIIQWLIRNIEFPSKNFVEFGVEDYSEANTRFLLMNDNWSGLVMDGSGPNMARLRNSELYWRYDLTARAAFIDAENINMLLAEERLPQDTGILHIDIDGNDYWVWKAIDVIRPIVAIIEYNSVFGCDRAITVPYDKAFFRTTAHYSNLYFGASLPALCDLAVDKGYRLVGCNSAGNNAYFVRSDKMSVHIPELSLNEAFVEAKLRESRDERGRLTHLRGAARLDCIRGLPVFDTRAQKISAL